MKHGKQEQKLNNWPKSRSLPPTADVRRGGKEGPGPSPMATRGPPIGGAMPWTADRRQNAGDAPAPHAARMRDRRAARKPSVAATAGDAKMTPDQVAEGHGARPAAQDETLEFGLLEAFAQIVCGHYRNNFDFRVEMMKKRLARHDEP